MFFIALEIVACLRSLSNQKIGLIARLTAYLKKCYVPEKFSLDFPDVSTRLREPFAEVILFPFDLLHLKLQLNFLILILTFNSEHTTCLGVIKRGVKPELLPMMREAVLFANYTQPKLVLQKIPKKPHAHTVRSGRRESFQKLGQQT